MAQSKRIPTFLKSGRNVQLRLDLDQIAIATRGRDSSPRVRPVSALIWINGGAVNSVDVFLMTTHRRPSVRHCPICGIAMQAAKSWDNLTEFDVFQCLTCETTIRESKLRKQRPGDASEK